MKSIFVLTFTDVIAIGICAVMVGSLALIIAQDAWLRRRNRKHKRDA